MFPSDVSMLRKFANEMAERIHQVIPAEKLYMTIEHKIALSFGRYEERVCVYISPRDSSDSVSFNAGSKDSLEREFLSVALPKIARWFGVSAAELAERPKPADPREQRKQANVAIAVVNVRQRPRQSWGEWLFGC